MLLDSTLLFVYFINYHWILFEFINSRNFPPVCLYAKCHLHFPVIWKSSPTFTCSCKASQTRRKIFKINFSQWAGDASTGTIWSPFCLPVRSQAAAFWYRLQLWIGLTLQSTIQRGTIVQLRESENMNDLFKVNNHSSWDISQLDKAGLHTLLI